MSNSSMLLLLLTWLNLPPVVHPAGVLLLLLLPRAEQLLGGPW
jgi:hypothetical protein